MSRFPSVGKYNIGDLYTNQKGETRILGYDYQMVTTPTQSGGGVSKRKLRGRKKWLQYDDKKYQKLASVYLSSKKGGARGAQLGSFVSQVGRLAQDPRVMQGLQTGLEVAGQFAQQQPLPQGQYPQLGMRCPPGCVPQPQPQYFPPQPPPQFYPPPQPY